MLSRYEGAPLERPVDLALNEWVDFVLIANGLHGRDWQVSSSSYRAVCAQKDGAFKQIRVSTVLSNHDASGVITRQISWY